MNAAQQRIFDRIAAAGHRGISTDHLLDFVYADHPDGGPDTARKSLHGRIRKINQHLRPQGLVIRAGPSGNSSGIYRLLLEEQASMKIEISPDIPAQERDRLDKLTRTIADALEGERMTDVVQVCGAIIGHCLALAPPGAVNSLLPKLIAYIRWTEVSTRKALKETKKQ